MAFTPLYFICGKGYKTFYAFIELLGFRRPLKQEVGAHSRGVAGKPASLEANVPRTRLPVVRRRSRQRPTRRSMKRQALEK